MVRALTVRPDSDGTRPGHGSACKPGARRRPARGTAGGSCSRHGSRAGIAMLRGLGPAEPAQPGQVVRAGVVVLEQLPVGGHGRHGVLLSSAWPEGRAVPEEHRSCEHYSIPSYTVTIP